MKEKSYMLNADEVSKMLSISKSKSYVLIRQFNRELEDKGFYTISGRIPRAYLESKIYGYTDQKQIRH
ncbi:MAG: DNA-binding protein [Lachnospiraceae bacterium]|nr:DNA-binding protein [Lachnospiraceae bacterium]MDO4966915.1 DNA-binding protein [Lachnospiraceae bacterium]